MNPDGSDLNHLVASPSLIASNVERSPGKYQIAFDLEGSVWLMDFSGNTQKIAEGSDPAWSPDGGHLAYVDKDGGIALIEVGGTAIEKIVASGRDPHWGK